MPLPIGVWFLNGNGFTGDLTVTAVNANGNLSATVYGGQQTTGFWDEASQKITFLRIINAADPSTSQVFTGYLFQNASGNDTVYTLAGSFEAFAGTGAVAQRVIYGWFAQITVKTKDKEKEQGKDTKDNKDRKDHKDNKDDAKEKERPKENVKDKEIAKDFENLQGVQGEQPGGPAQPASEHGDQPTARGQAFIRAEERPPVGKQLLQDTDQIQGAHA